MWCIQKMIRFYVVGVNHGHVIVIIIIISLIVTIIFVLYNVHVIRCMWNKSIKETHFYWLLVCSILTNEFGHQLLLVHIWIFVGFSTKLGANSLLVYQSLIRCCLFLYTNTAVVSCKFNLLICMPFRRKNIKISSGWPI